MLSFFVISLLLLLLTQCQSAPIAEGSKEATIDQSLKTEASIQKRHFLDLDSLAGIGTLVFFIVFLVLAFVLISESVKCWCQKRKETFTRYSFKIGTYNRSLFEEEDLNF